MGVQSSKKKSKCRTLHWNHNVWKKLGVLCNFIDQIQNFPKFPYSWDNWEFFANLFSRNFKTWFSDSWQNFKWIFGALHFLAFSNLCDPPRGHGGHLTPKICRTKNPLKILPEIRKSSLKITRKRIWKNFSVFSVLREFH